MTAPVGPRSDAGPAAARIAEVGPAEFVRGDEELLGSPAAAVRVVRLATRCLSYGVGEAPSADYVRRAEERGIAQVARATGGSGLLHEAGDLAWSIVLPRTDPRVGREFPRAYARFGDGVVGWLRSLGIAAEWGEAPGTAPRYCTLSDRGHVLRAGGRIVGGAAQHLTRHGFLHQGTVSVQIDRPEIDAVFDLPPPSPTSALGALDELLVTPASAAEYARLRGALAEALARPP